MDFGSASNGLAPRRQKRASLIEGRSLAASNRGPAVTGLELWDTEMNWKSDLRMSKRITVPTTTNVPTRVDYIEAVLEAGELAVEDQFPLNRELVIDVHRDWLKRRQVGCVYAQTLNSDPEKYGMAAVIVPDGNDMRVAQVAELIAEETSSVENANSEALSILLPGLTDLATFCRLVRALAEENDWQLREVTEHVDPATSVVFALVGIDFVLKGSVPSAVLGIGPFEEFPLTRRGPVASLELRLKPKDAKRAKKRPGMPLTSHLAQVPYPEPGRIAREEDSMWQQTESLRLAVLGRNDERAKAEVTLAVPRNIWIGSKTTHT